MQGQWHEVAAESQGAAAIPDPDSEASFIAEHYWGYVRQIDGSTVEYQVEHPPWHVDGLRSCEVKIDAGLVYGTPWHEVLRQPPVSSFLALGSPIRVRRGVPLPDTRPG